MGEHEKVRLCMYMKIFLDNGLQANININFTPKSIDNCFLQCNIHTCTINSVIQTEYKMLL